MASSGLCQYCAQEVDISDGGRYERHEYGVQLDVNLVYVQCPGTNKFKVELSGDNIHKDCVYCGQETDFDVKLGRYLGHFYETSGDILCLLVCPGSMKFRIEELE